MAGIITIVSSTGNRVHHIHVFYCLRLHIRSKSHSFTKVKGMTSKMHDMYDNGGMAKEVDDQQNYCGRRTCSDGARRTSSDGVATYGDYGSRRMSAMEIGESLDIDVRWMKLEWLDRLEA
ncbi:unnamed protein product [Lactuca virosa]|uniref:Uncharacterized protein n=1 Tax=Lactuca virosa TaxID=75947 RepID=A0AAU9M545_9ASTR|nr:unnamed protein product [Lactuca virosa]